MNSKINEEQPEPSDSDEGETSVGKVQPLSLSQTANEPQEGEHPHNSAPEQIDIGSTNTKSQDNEKNRFRWALKAVEIIFTAVIASVLTVVATLYIQRKNVPKLSMDYSWCTAVTEPAQNSENEFGTVLVDLHTQSMVEGGAFYIKINAERGKGFTFTPNVRSYIGKMIIYNDGQSPANNVKVGVGYMFPADMSISVSPNVHAVLIPIDPKIYGESVYWPNRHEIQIEDLPPGEKAFITLSWRLDPSAKNSLLGVVKPNT